MELFLSCDWGTSSFWLRLIDAGALVAIAEETNSQGIGAAFEQWKKRNVAEGRFFFYLAFIKDAISRLEQKAHISLQQLPLILSGMASSSIGMIEMAYKELPFDKNGADLAVKMIEADDQFSHPMLIVSGVKTGDDVMRGEETVLIGCSVSGTEQVFIMPGTHSKHLYVQNNRVTRLQTYMTGEFFNLLTSKSVLSASVEQGNGLTNGKNLRSFEKGVKEGQGPNLLHSAFSVRTNELLSKLSKEENYYYLSGLLIGAEISDLKSYNGDIILVANQDLMPYYVTAIQTAGLKQPVLLQDADEALIRGQHKIYTRYFPK